MRHVMKIGPLALDAKHAHAYAAFGQGGLAMVIEDSDAKGLAALTHQCKKESLVCEPALAQIAAARGLQVAELPPSARRLKAGLAVSLDHGSSLEKVSPSLIFELIEATVAFDAAKPWQVFAADEPLSVQIEPKGREFEGCVLGADGDEFGLALYHHPGSIARVQAFVAEGRPESAASLACTTVLLADEGTCSVGAVAELTGVSLAPQVHHISQGGLRAAGPDDLAVLIAGLRAVTALAQGRTPRGETQDPAHRVVARATRAGSKAVPRSPYAGVGRNQPCPCGSGKKFKRCHLEVVEAPAPEPSSLRAKLHQRDERLAADILEYGKRRFGAERLVRGLHETLGDRKALGQLVTPWLAYGLPFEGEPLAAHFLRSRSSLLSADDRRWIERQLATRVGVWEILSVDQGRGVEAVELLTGKRCFVHEVMATGILAVRDTILARAVDDEIVVFCGVHEMPLDPQNADAVLTRLGEASAEAGTKVGAEVGSRHEADLRLIELWEGQAAEQRRKAASPMTFLNTDGHAAEVVKDRFALRSGSFTEVLERLAALEEVSVDEHDRSGARLTFARAGNAAHAHWANTIIGTARLTATGLVVETNSLERAEALTARLREALGELATWKKRTREALEERLGGETVMVDGQLVTTGAEAAVRDAHRGWLEQPVPSLGGRSPREAARDAEGRRAVHLLLKQQENQRARSPLPGLDPAQLRRELGLDELGHPLANLDLVRALGSGRKLSETLLDFAQPMLDAEGAQVNERRLRDALGFAIEVWNSMVAATEAGIQLDLAAFRAEMTTDRWLAWAEPLATRKREQFADDLRFVGNWRVLRQRDLLDIQMEARISQSLLARVEAAGMR